MKYFFGNPVVLALASLVGTIVGAGIFALPYAISQSGVIPGIFYFAVMGGVVMMLHLFFGEFSLRTKATHRLIGFAKLYLGGAGKSFAVFAILFSNIGALLAYTIIGGEFLHTVLSPFVEVSSFQASLVFWGILSLFVLRGIKLIAKAELLMNIALFAAVGVIFFFAIPLVRAENFSGINPSNVFLPYGLILFAFAGWSAIPEIAELFKKKKDKQRLDNVIVASSAITIILYALFAFIIVGVSGAATSQEGLGGLVPFLGKNIVMLGSFLGLMAIASSYIILGNYLKNSLKYDFKINHGISTGVATIIPLLLFLAGIWQFAEVLDVVGAISLGAIEGVLIILVYRKAKKQGDRRPEYSLKVPDALLFLLMVILIGGAAVKVFYILFPMIKDLF